MFNPGKGHSSMVRVVNVKRHSSQPGLVESFFTLTAHSHISIKEGSFARLI